MGIGTSLGAYFETELDHHAGNDTPQLDSQHKGVGNWFKDEWDKNEYSGEGITHDNTPIPVGEYLGSFPSGEGPFNNWDEIHNHKLKGLTPEEFMKTQPEDTEGFHEQSPRDWMMLRRKKTEPLVSQNEAKVIPVSDIKTASPLVTITDSDIEKGMGLGMGFAGGGLTTKNVTQFRRAANDNKKLQIDNPKMDEEMSNSWQNMVDRQVRGDYIVNEREKLMEVLKSRDWNDIEKQKMKVLNKAHDEHFTDRPDWW